MIVPTAINFLLQAIAIDSGSSITRIIRLASAYWAKESYSEGKKWCLMVYNKKDQDASAAQALDRKDVFPLFRNTIPLN